LTSVNKLDFSNNEKGVGTSHDKENQRGCGELFTDGVGKL
jgi:hypothetical protein